MHIFYSPLRALEQKFISHVTGLQAGPGKPLLVLCPSGRVAAHLQKLMLRQQDIVSNVYFKTFGQLLTELDRETGACEIPLLPANGLQDYLLKNILQDPSLKRYKPSQGVISALKSSLHDLADGLADPVTLKEHVQTMTDPALLADEQHWQWLVEVYARYMQEMEQVKGYRSYKKYFEQALEAAEKSAYLRNFSEIIFYGFYDFTGRQLELFNALRLHYPVSVFWVYSKEESFRFGRKFFEANILGASLAEELSQDTSRIAAKEVLSCLFSDRSTAEKPENISIFSAPEIEGELFFVAKEIQKLHEEHHIAYEDMAVVARNMEPYQERIGDVFSQNFIPLKASFAQKISRLPLGVFVFNLLSLARKGFDREAVLAIVNSPYFRHKNQWRYLIAESLAQRDFDQWADLIRPSLSSYDPAFMPWLSGLKAQLSFVEKSLPWSQLCEALRQVLQDNTDISVFSLKEKKIWSGLIQQLKDLSDYGLLCEKAREREFLDEFFAGFENLKISQEYDMPAGVQALDVMALRGLSFKVVFVLGLNEKVFPQIIREDPILKDYYRRILRDQLGFWINQKMERFDEERLLFYCTLESATEKLYLSYLRSDAEGKPLIASSYLMELTRSGGIEWEEGFIRVNGRMLDRLSHLPLSSLTQKELSLLLASFPQSESSYEKAELLTDALKEGLQAAQEISSWGKFNSRDGQVEHGRYIFEQQNEHGFSPSALQDLARCPMKYFLSKGLGLREPDESYSRSELAPNLRGSAYHEILMDYYENLLKDGAAGTLFDNALAERLKQSLAKHYQPQSYRLFGIYPVIWELILEDMEAKLTRFVLQDAQHLNGYIPSVFETVFEKNHALSAGLNIKLKGIIDRIDIHAQSKTFRIIDYKSSKHGGKNLSVDMFKHLILQPFIYLILADQSSQTAGLTPDGAALLSINKGYSRQELTQTDFEQIYSKAQSFLALLMKILLEGNFFICPSADCEFCPYTGICRKNSFRSLLRARRWPEYLRLEESKK